MTEDGVVREWKLWRQVDLYIMECDKTGLVFIGDRQE